MRKVLFRNAITSPGKLVALCFVVYFATISFAVAAFLLLLSARWVMVEMKKKAKAIEAAEAARAEAQKLASRQMAASGSVENVTASAAANDRVAAPAPAKQYAKSAVVIPFKTGTQ
jgi:hypothetical protein